MSQDFITQLQTQLRHAAEREARRGSVARAARAARWRIGTQPVLAGAALALLALAVVLAAPALRRGEEPVAPGREGPRIVARLPLGNQGAPVATGFGAVWTGEAGRVLRVDPRTARVLERIPVAGGPPAVNVGAGAVWALAGDDLLRIDPRKNRVAARIPLGLPVQSAWDVAAGRGVMWVATSTELLRIDPKRNVVDRRIDISSGAYQASGPPPYGGDALYIERGDGVLVGRDWRTGARVSVARPQITGFLLAAAGETVVTATADGVAAVNARTGRTVWTRSLGTARVNGALIDGRVLWVHGTLGLRRRDHLWRMDLRTGRSTAEVALPEFGVAGGAVVGDRLWLTSPGGRLTIVAG